MPPPNFCSPQDNCPSANDQKSYENSKTSATETYPEEECRSGLKGETLVLVKSLLGPTLEGTVLRTLEYGKSIIQGADVFDGITTEDVAKLQTKDVTDCDSSDFNLEKLLSSGMKKNTLKGILSQMDRNDKKGLTFLYNINKKNSSSMQSNAIRNQVYKIRSLDSELKQSSPSPNDIKKRLQALIQISKNEKQSWLAHLPQIPKITKMPPVDMSAVTNLYKNQYKNQVELKRSSSCNSKTSKEDDCTTGTSTLKRRNRSKICQAPDFISNALGPTIDVSIIDNINMMRQLLSKEAGKGEECMRDNKQGIQLPVSEGDLTSKIQMLQKKIEELEEKEQCLLKHIEEQNRQLMSKKKEVEDKWVGDTKPCLESLSDKKLSVKCQAELGGYGKFDNVQAKVNLEEEKLATLKCQFNQYKLDIAEAKMKRESLKTNKCLLDAWDVFASRICHTKLPSYSRAYTLEPKPLQSSSMANFHCCLPPVSKVSSKQSCLSRSGSKTSCGSKSRCNVCAVGDGPVNLQTKIQMGQIPFPIQRDIFCGLHQVLKTCKCRNTNLVDKCAATNSGDDILKLSKASRTTLNESMAIGSAAMSMGLGNAGGDKASRRSVSDLGLKHERCSKIVKVMWALARINIFQNNIRTYEILEASATPPCRIPNKTEGIFVVKSQKKCPTQQRKGCLQKPARY